MANRQSALIASGKAPSTWYDDRSYNDISGPRLTPPAGRMLTIDPAKVRDGIFRGIVDAPDGPGLVATNIAGGPYLVKVHGLVPVGRDFNGFLVVRRRADDPAGRASIAIGTATMWPVAIGRWSSVGALAALVVLIFVLAARGRRAADATVRHSPDDGDRIPPPQRM